MYTNIRPTTEYLGLLAQATADDGIQCKKKNDASPGQPASVEWKKSSDILIHHIVCYFCSTCVARPTVFVPPALFTPVYLLNICVCPNVGSVVRLKLCGCFWYLTRSAGHNLVQQLHLLQPLVFQVKQRTAREVLTYASVELSQPGNAGNVKPRDKITEYAALQTANPRRVKDDGK